MLLAVAGCIPPVCAQQLPTITIQPVPQRVVAGHELQLTVSATAGPHTPEIQWYHDGVPIPGKTMSALRIPNTGEQHEGLYKALASMRDGASWSREVFVQIEASPPSPGLLDNTFISNFYNPSFPVRGGDSIDAVLVLPDGRIAIGGEFRINSRISNLAILMPDGSVDPRFALSIPGGRILALALSQGRLIAAGDFDSVNGRPCGGIAAMDPDTGILSPDWNHSLGFAPGGPFTPRIHTLCPTDDGGLMVGGTFTFWRSAAGATQRPLLVRLKANGEPDDNFALSPVSGGEVRSVRLTPDGDLAVAGSFTSPTERFTLLRPDGGLVPGFSLTQPPLSRVRDVLPLPDGSFLLGGDFNDLTGKRLAHFFADGALDLNFNVDTDDDVNTLALDPAGRVILGGDFSMLDGVPHLFIGRLNADLTLDETFRSDGLDQEVSALAISGAKLLAGGDFTGPHPLLARLLLDSGQPDEVTAIIRPPSAGDVILGSPLDLNVTVFPARTNRQFLWTKDGEFFAHTLVPVLAIDQITPAHAGDYQVEITDPSGTITTPPVRVKPSPALPGHEQEFRYHGGSTALVPGPTTSAMTVPDNFILSDVRVTVDIVHPNTDHLIIELEPPGSDRITLFDDNLSGRDMRHTTFDDGASGLKIKDALPPFTGSFRPLESFSPLIGTSSSGTWKLIFSGIEHGQLLDWSLELRAEEKPISYLNYVQATGVADSPATRRAYAVAQHPVRKSAGLVPHELSESGFRCSHWRWTAPPDTTYSYELLVPGGWVKIDPSQVHITRFPGKREFHEIRFPLGRERSYYRLRTTSIK